MRRTPGHLWVSLVCSPLIIACAAPDPAPAVPAAQEQVALSQSSLMAAPTGMSSDTAGIEARIATAFPGWRLSTEQEIADRFRASFDYMRPEEMWQPNSFGDFQGKWMGSGQRWWVWPGDFDRDGSSDVLTIISNQADPTQGKAVVLHGNGTAAELSDSNDGIAAFPGEDGKAEIVWLVWEKVGGTYEWDPATRTYQSVEPERECC